MNYQSLQTGQEVFFVGERLPMKIKAINEHYAVVTRPLNKKEDKQLIRDSGYSSFEACAKEDVPIYAILDFAQEWKGPHGTLFTDYDYNTEKGCERVLRDITSGEIEMSRRNHIDLNINWDKTIID